MMNRALTSFPIFEKQRLPDNGKVIYLELAALDPRCLMHGNDMALQFNSCRVCGGSCC